MPENKDFNPTTETFYQAEHPKEETPNTPLPDEQQDEAYETAQSAVKDAMRSRLFLRVMSLAALFIIGTAILGAKQLGRITANWHTHTFNDSERIDCLERGEHRWEYIGYGLDGVYGDDWNFQCTHCFKTTTKDKEHMTGPFAEAFKKATGVEFPVEVNTAPIPVTGDVPTLYEPNDCLVIRPAKSTTVTFGGSKQSRNIDANDVRTMPIEELRDMAAAVMILSGTGMMCQEFNDAVLDRLVFKKNRQ